MDASLVWLSIVLMALAAYCNRALFILLAGTVELPAPVRRALRYVPPAVLSALIVSALVMPAGNLELSMHNERIWAGGCAWLVAVRTRNVMLTILCGLTVLHLLRFSFTS